MFSVSRELFSVNDDSGVPFLSGGAVIFNTWFPRPPMCGLPGGRVRRKGIVGRGGPTERGRASLGSGTCRFAILSVDEKFVFCHDKDMRGWRCDPAVCRGCREDASGEELAGVRGDPRAMPSGSVLRHRDVGWSTGGHFGF